MKLKSLFSLFLITTLILIGCARTDAIYNVNSAPITVASTKSYTLADVRNAIVRAGAGIGWQMQEVAPGHIVGTLIDKITV